MLMLSNLLGDAYQAKILEVLVENYNDEFSIPEIIEIAGTSRGSTYSYIKLLESNDFVKKIRKIGSTQLYKLDIDNQAIKPLILIDRILIKENLEKELKIKKSEKLSPIPNIMVIGKSYSSDGKVLPITYTSRVKFSEKTKLKELEELKWKISKIKK